MNPDYYPFPKLISPLNEIKVDLAELTSSTTISLSLRPCQLKKKQDTQPQLAVFAPNKFASVLGSFLFLKNLFSLSFTEKKALVLTWQKLDQPLRPILHIHVSQLQQLSPFCSRTFPSLEGFSSASHSYFLHPAPGTSPEQLAEARDPLAFPFTSEPSLPVGKDLPLVLSITVFF